MAAMREVPDTVPHYQQVTYRKYTPKQVSNLEICQFEAAGVIYSVYTLNYCASISQQFC
jgi:hypothetical protein